MRFRRWVFWAEFVPLILMMGGCASSHNYNSDGANPLGGGFFDRELKRGLFELVARSNAAPWANFAAAKATWKTRADQLCGENAYSEIVQSQDAGRGGSMPAYVKGQEIPLPRYNATMTGYVLCNFAGITVEEARRYLDDINALAARQRIDYHKSELARLGGSACGESDPKVNAETYFRRGRALIALNQYEEAMHCLLKAQEEKGTHVYRESCYLIATMYELGWGVSTSMEVANAWRKKAEL